MELTQAQSLVFRSLHEAGFECYLVGGPVRDTLLGRSVHDYDFTTNATPEQMLEVFPRAFHMNRFGTVIVPLLGEVFEITTYRSEGKYSDQRHPDSVEFVKSLEEDLSRRDFTINAMAMTEDGSVIDPYGGQTDLEQRVVVCVGDSTERFAEDPLRIMRAVRFAAQLGFSIEWETRQAIIACAASLKTVSRERIRDELIKILGAGQGAVQGYDELVGLDLLQYILPVTSCYGFLADAAAMLRASVDACWQQQLAGILVTIKNYDWKVDLKSLKLGAADEQFIRSLITGYGMFDKFQSADTLTVKMLLQQTHQRAGLEAHLLLEKRARTARLVLLRDRSSWNCRDLEAVEKEMHRIIDSGEPYLISHLAVNGDDIVAIDERKPGPWVGEKLRELLKLVIVNPEMNTREILLSN